MIKFLEKIKTIILALVVVICVIFVTIFVIGNRNNKALSDELTVIHGATSTNEASEEPIQLNNGEIVPFSQSILPEMQPLIDRNTDTVGWVTIDGLNLDYVVVQGEDNEKYLYKDFDGNYAEAGTIFADQYCVLNPNIKCNNIILYGHNQMNGSMFGYLTKYKKDPMFVKEAPIIKFNTNYNYYEFKIFACYIINTEEEHDNEPLYRYHTYTSFNDSTSYDTFIDQTLKRSLITSDIDVSPDDLFITLSTCAVDFDGARFVVVGRAVRNEEDRAAEANYSLNENAYFPQIYYDLGCSNFRY